MGHVPETATACGNRGPESSRNFQLSFCTWFLRGVISQSRSLNLKWASTSGAALTVALIAYSELEEHERCAKAFQLFVLLLVAAGQFCHTRASPLLGLMDPWSWIR